MPHHSAAAPPALSVSALSVRFGGLTAVDHVTFEAPRGLALGLIGPNGAGKTTCFNAITGMVPATGSVRFGDQELLGQRSERIARRGIARTFQHVAVVPDLTVRENVLIGAYRHGRLGWVRSGLRLGTRAEAREAAARADDAIERLGLAAIAHRHCSDLGLPNLKLVELARAVAFEPQVLLLDEPANGLTHSEVDGLSERINQLQAERDLTVVVVEHHMGLIRAVADHLVVLNFGSLLAQGAPDEVLSSPQVIEAYLGVSA